jgi:integrase
MSWPFSPIVKILIATAARRDEVGGMRWSELALDRRIWSIPSSRRKGGIAHEVPLNDLAMEVIESLPRIGDSDWVFPARARAGGKGGGHFSGWSKGKARLDALRGVKNATTHDIRRSVATKLQELGISVAIVEEILGHTSGSRAGIIRTYQRYRYGPEKKAALDSWWRRVTALLDPPAADNVR